MLFEARTGRVRDHVRFDGELTLYVDRDAYRMMTEIIAAGDAVRQVTIQGTPEELQTAALGFASSIFGIEQGKKLMNFYHGDAACVLNVCGKYFSVRLAKKITKVQKKQYRRREVHDNGF